GAVAAPALPLVAELGDRASLAVGDEDRVVAEARGTPSLLADAALEHPRASELLEARREADELAHVPCSPRLSFGSGELGQEFGDVLLVARVAARIARRTDSRAPGETLDLEPRVLAED